MSDDEKVITQKTYARRQPALPRAVVFLGFIAICLGVAAVGYAVVGIPWAIHRMQAPWSSFGEGPDRLAGTWVGDLASGRAVEFGQYGYTEASSKEGVIQPVMIDISFSLDMPSLSLNGKVSHCGPNATRISQPFDGRSVSDPRFISLPVHTGATGVDYQDYDVILSSGTLAVATAASPGKVISGHLHKGTTREFQDLCRRAATASGSSK